MKMGDEIFRCGAESAKSPCLPAKVSDESLKQAIGPCYPLFWGSHSEQSAQEQAQVKASRSNFVPLGEIFFSLERGPAHPAERGPWTGQEAVLDRGHDPPMGRL